MDDQALILLVLSCASMACCLCWISITMVVRESRLAAMLLRVLSTLFRYIFSVSGFSSSVLSTEAVDTEAAFRASAYSGPACARREAQLEEQLMSFSSSSSRRSAAHELRYASMSLEA